MMLAELDGLLRHRIMPTPIEVAAMLALCVVLIAALA